MQQLGLQILLIVFFFLFNTDLDTDELKQEELEEEIVEVLIKEETTIIE